MLETVNTDRHATNGRLKRHGRAHSAGVVAGALAGGSGVTVRSRRADAALAPVAARLKPLTDALECLVLRSWIPSWLELTAHWGLDVTTHLGWFYLVGQGSARIEVGPHESTVRVAAGDLVVVAPGCPHRVADEHGSPTVPLSGLLEPRRFERRAPLVHGGGGRRTVLLCGGFACDPWAACGPR